MLKFIAKLASIILICSASLVSYANDKKHTSAKLKLVEQQIYSSLEKNGLPKSSITIQWSKSVTGAYIATIKCNIPEKCGKQEVSIPFTDKNLINKDAPNYLNANEAKQLQPLFENTGNEGPQVKPSPNGELESKE